MKPILYTLLALLLFTTCRKDTTKPADQHFYYYLTKEQLSKTPYFTNPAFDTLTYISNQNDTLIFAKTKTDTLWYISSVFDPGGTADKYYHYQQLRNRYATLKGEGKFEVLHRKNNDVIEIDCNSFRYNISDIVIGRKTAQGYIDSISSNNITYYNLIKSYEIEGNYFFLNKEFGVFFIDNKKLQWFYIK